MKNVSRLAASYDPQELRNESLGGFAAPARTSPAPTVQPPAGPGWHAITIAGTRAGIYSGSVLAINPKGRGA